MQRLRLFGTHLSRRERRVYGAVIVFYILAVFGMTWPVYSLFSRARPLVLGMPLSLFYLACWVVGSFIVQLALFRWEGHRDDEDER